MTNHEFKSMDDIRDVESINKYKEMIAAGKTEKKYLRLFWPAAEITVVRQCNGIQNLWRFLRKSAMDQRISDLKTTNIEYHKNKIIPFITLQSN